MAAKAKAAQFPLPIGKEIKVRLGDSFNNSSPTAYHRVHYDFKPASFSSRRPGSVEIGTHRDVTMKFAKPQSVYTGNITSANKDCVMIIEADGSVTIERLWNSLRVKRARGMSSREMGPASELGENEAQQPHAKRSMHSAASQLADAGSDASDGDDFIEASPSMGVSGSSATAAPRLPIQIAPPATSGNTIPVRAMSSSDSSSSSSDSGSDSSSSDGDSSDDSSDSSDSDGGLLQQLDKQPTAMTARAPTGAAGAGATSTVRTMGGGGGGGNLSSDLEMSDSDSDSD